MSRLSRRHHFLLLGVLASFCLIFAISWHYQASPWFITQTLTRGVALAGIEMITNIYDPSPPLLQTNLGPTPSQPDQTKGLAENLLQLISQWKTTRSIKIEEFNNQYLTKSPFPFGYQTAHENRLINLKKKYHLQSLLVSDQTDFEQLTTIANWVHSQWQHGTSGASVFNPDDFNADFTLSQAQLGKRFWCQVYAMTFVQVAASLGYQARLVSLTKDGYSAADHAVVEAWSSFYNKWILLDIDFNIWYSKNGIPLSTLEVHNAFVAGTTDALTIVRGRARPVADFESRIPSLYQYYRYFYVDMRNDWLSNRYFPGHPARSDKATLFWNDPTLPPIFTLFTKVSDAKDLYWDLNRTYMTFENSARTEELILHLHTHTPDFSFFQIHQDGKVVAANTSGIFTWRLHNGINEISVRSINSSGIPGSQSHIRLSLNH